MPKPLKIALSVLLVLAILTGIGAAVYFLLLKPHQLQGDPDNYVPIRLEVRDNIYYTVHVPAEAKLMQTDEHTIYQYDKLTVGVRDAEPTDVDYKLMVEGRWVYAKSPDRWLAAVAKGFDTEVSETVAHYFDPLYAEDPETHEQVLVDYADGPAPVGSTQDNAPNTGSTLYGPSDYIIYTEQYGTYDYVLGLQLDRLYAMTGLPSPHYYYDGHIMYATQGDYVVGMVWENWNTQYAIVAKGTNGIRDAINILTRG